MPTIIKFTATTGTNFHHIITASFIHSVFGSKSSYTPSITTLRHTGRAILTATARVLKIAQQRGYKVILWSIDTRDWTRPPEKRIVDEVFKGIKPGSIILMHDGQYPIPTPHVLGTLIDGLRERGYTFVTVSELLQYNEVGHTTPSISLF